MVSAVYRQSQPALWAWLRKVRTPNEYGVLLRQGFEGQAR